MAFSIESVPNQAGKPAILLREAWREGRKIHKRTVASLSSLPPEAVEGFRAVLKGAVAVSDISELMQVERSLQHGHVAAVLGTARGLGLERVLHRSGGRERRLALASVVARVLWPDPKLATARRLSPATATGSLGALLGLGPVTGRETLRMLDWLLARQPWIERSLANRHLKDGSTLVLYDVSSSYLEGTCCPLADFGHSRDGKKSRRQIVFGLLCAADGCPVAVEVLPGNTGDPSTVASQVAKVRRRFGIDRVALVGGRGMTATARIREDVWPAGLDWISALKTADIRKLLKAPGPDAAAPLDPEALEEDAVAEITGPDFPGERLMVCLNPRLRDERRRKREELLQETERTLAEIAAAARGKPGQANRDRTLKALGREASRRKTEKRFDIAVGDGGMDWKRSRERIAEETSLDGVHLVGASLDAASMGAEAAVEDCKSLVGVERTFRNAKSDLRIRPACVYTSGHVRAHVFLCMLALHVEWHMRRRLAPMLSGESAREGARAQRGSPVEKARPSESARRKAAAQRTEDGLPVHSFNTLLDDLSGVALNQLRLSGHEGGLVTAVTSPTPVQKRAFGPPGVDPARNVPIRLPA